MKTYPDMQIIFPLPICVDFEKGYSTLHSLIIMLEKMEKALDNKNIAGAVLTNLSKAFDSLDREFAKKQSKNDVHWRELHIFCPRIGYDYLRKLS